MRRYLGSRPSERDYWNLCTHSIEWTMALSGESSILSGVSGVTIQDFQLATAQWNVQEKLKAIKDGGGFCLTTWVSKSFELLKSACQSQERRTFQPFMKELSRSQKLFWVILEWSWRSSLRGARVMGASLVKCMSRLMGPLLVAVPASASDPVKWLTSLAFFMAGLPSTRTAK